MTKEEAIKMLNDCCENEITIKICQNNKRQTLLKNIPLGTVINGGKYIVVEHFENGTTGIVKKEAIKPNIQFGDTNEWNKSDLRKYLNTQYLNKITSEFGEIELHTVDMLSMDGDDSYGKCEDIVSAMTFDRWRKYYKYIGNVNYTEWLSTPSQTENSNDSRCVQVVYSDGCVNYRDCSWSDCSVRPFFILKSSITVSLDKA